MNLLKRWPSYIVTGTLLAMACAGAIAGDLTLSASVNTNTVGLNDRLVLQVNVSGGSANIPKPALPAMPSFTVYSAGTSQNMSFVNGTFSSSLSYQYVLVPKSTGKFTIPPVTLQYEGKAYQTQAIPVEVTAAAAPAPAAGAAANDAGSRDQTKPGKNVFITASVDKPAAYVNEQVTYTFRFYTRLRLTSNPQLSPPDFSGFWTEDTPPRNYTATVNGRQYSVTEVKTLLFPSHPGKFTLGAATLRCNVEDFNSSDPFSDDFFRSFFSGGRTQVVQTEPVTITVQALPENGKPQGFSGAVGRFHATASLDKASVKSGEPATLNVTVTGTGNIKTLIAPALPDWQDIRKYETVSALNIGKDGGQVQGSKTFKTVIVPQVPGRKTIAAGTFSFFDPAQRKYVTEPLPALALNVLPGAVSAGAPLPAPAAGDIKMVTRDIRYIKTPAAWKPYTGPLLPAGWLISLNLLPLLAFAGAFAYRRRQDRLQSDVAYARRRKASAAAKRYLKHARALLAAGTPVDFYTAIARALLEYIAHKANVSADGLTFAAMATIFQQKNVSAETAAGVKELLDECDLVRFAPANVTPDAMQRTCDRAQELIGKLEKELH